MVLCSFLLPKSVTLNDLERRNGPYFALLYEIRYFQRIHCVKAVDDKPYISKLSAILLIVILIN